MKFSTQIKPPSYKQHEETLALLQILALGNHEIEQNHYKAVNEVFTDLERVGTG